MDLDQQVAALLPEGVQFTRTPKDAAAITLRHLATHSSGLQRGLDHPVQKSNNSYTDFDRSMFYKALPRAELTFRPGSDSAYSNLGYGLLAHCLELLTGRSFNDLIKEFIFVPEELLDTFVLDQGNADQLTRLASRYADSGRDRGRLEITERLVGSGGLVSTPSDVARLGAFLLRARAGKEPLVPADSPLARAVSYRNEPDGVVVSFGWDRGGTRIPNTEDVQFPKKNGGRAGASAYLLLSAAGEGDFAVAVSLNLDVDSDEGTTAGGIAREIMRGLLNK